MMRVRPKRARTSDTIERWRNAMCDKHGRDEQEDTIRPTHQARHLKWCLRRRADYAVRKVKVATAQISTQVQRVFSRAITFVRHFDSDQVIDQGLQMSYDAWERMLADKPWWVRWVHDEFAAPRIAEAMRGIKSRLRKWWKDTWMARLVVGIQRVIEYKCPFCGTHTARRLCSYQTFRLFSIDIKHALEILSGRSYGPEDKVRVLSSLYHWSVYGADTLEPLRDVMRIFRFCVGDLTFPLFDSAIRLASSAAQAIYILTGRKFEIPGRENMVKRFRLEQLGRMNTEVDAIVWNVWFAFDRLILSVRGTWLRLLRPEDVDQLCADILDMQMMFYGEDSIIVNALQKLKAEGVPGTTNALPWAAFNQTRTFQSFRLAAEALIPPPAPIMVAGPVAPGPPPPPPPPAPLPRLRQPGTSAFWSNMSREEREVAYLSSEPWPRCHVGWVCASPVKHCMYPVPGVIPPHPEDLDVSRLTIRLVVDPFRQRLSRRFLGREILKLWESRYDAVLGVVDESGRAEVQFETNPEEVNSLYPRTALSRHPLTNQDQRYPRTLPSPSAQKEHETAMWLEARYGGGYPL